jgi:hypothetical protein
MLLLPEGQMGEAWVKVKVKFTLEQATKDQNGSSTLPSTSALDGVGDQRHDPVALSSGKTRYPLYRRLGGFQGRSGRVRKISPPPGFDPQTVQPVVSRYTGSAIRPLTKPGSLPKSNDLRKSDSIKYKPCTRNPICPVWLSEAFLLL